jgi:accessory gene regulator protein AgrB
MAQCFPEECIVFSTLVFAASFPLNTSDNNSVFVLTAKIALNVSTFLFSPNVIHTKNQIIRDKMGEQN